MLLLILGECTWKNVTGASLLQLATSPNSIGQPSLGIRCTIIVPCVKCDRPYYVKYSNDNGTTWLGYNTQGTPGEDIKYTDIYSRYHKFAYI